MRFVVVHVPNPIQLIKAAVDCLKPGGVLLIEDCNAEGAVSDPPLFANTLIHRAHIEASLKLGADVRRGPWIGGYMKKTGLESIQSNVFVPVFGKGVNIHLWFQHTGEFDATAHYEQCLRLLRMSVESAAPQFLELGTCTEQELEAARESLDQADASDYQLFSIPGGQIFQWWATKPR
jgi:SAM-dependent methyltransferase